MSSEPKKTVVTSGVDSEYVLGDLAQVLRLRGYRVVEFNFGERLDDIKQQLRQLANESVAYITSSHTNFTLRTAQKMVPGFARLYTNYLAPVEILPILKPSISIFVPHDLLTPYGDSNVSESLLLDLYDHVMAPSNAESVQSQLKTGTRVHEAGWIKYQLCNSSETPTMSPASETCSSSIRPLRITFFVSMIEHMRTKYGAIGLVDYLMPILNSGVCVKLPAWRGIEEIEAAIGERTTAKIIPASVNSSKLIQQSDVVICNTVSSILAESISMGVPSVCLLDNEGTEASIRLEKLADFPSIQWHPYFDRMGFPDGYLETLAKSTLPRLIRPFDFDLLESLLHTGRESLDR
jgi:hypothetical protein